MDKLRRFLETVVFDRRHLREALKDCEERFRATFEQKAMGMIHVQLDGRIIRANKRYCELVGRDPQTVCNLTVADLTHPDDRACTQSMLHKALKGEVDSYRFEKRYLRGDGLAVWVEVTCSVVPAKGKTPGYVVATVQDISQRKQEAQALADAKAAAEAASRTKSAFLANMSHEIRTPLNAILGFSDILVEPGLSEEDRGKFAATIRRNGHLLAKLIDDILDLSKVEAGKLEIELLPVAIPALIYDVTTLLGRQAQESGIRLRTSIEGEIPERINSDPTRLRQILINIIGNAIKFTKHGEVHLTLTFLPGGGGRDDQLAFIVADTGRGISLEEQALLFQAFSQSEPSTTRKFGGTGLGLVLSRRLANLLGGDVTLTASAPGIGSTFTIRVATGRIAGVAMIRSIILDETAHRARLPVKPLKGRLQGIRVLLAEDAPDNQMLIRRILDGNGATVDIAADGLEVLTKAWASDYDIILMDLQMPRLDGYDATESLRRQGYRKPIIALTAHAMKEERERALKAGVNDHLTKPVSQNHLVITVEQYSHATAH